MHLKTCPITITWEEVQGSGFLPPLLELGVGYIQFPMAYSLDSWER